MKFSEKLYYYRKKAGLSQEALAARVGVSRQAVSKWETGEAMPEVEKLVALAQALGVTTDELLSPAEPTAPQSPPAPPRRDSSQLPGFLGRMIRQWGWLAGVYIAVSGLGITLVGALARYAFGAMYRATADTWISMGSSGWEVVDFGGGPFSSYDFPSGFPSAAGGVSSMGGVFVTIATVILVVGILVTITGVVLAAVLYQKGRKGD